jgi:putative NADH-flavin reductase
MMGIQGSRTATLNIVIFGASGATGRELVKQGLARGHIVTGFVRNPARLQLSVPNLNIVTGDVADRAAVDPAMAGQGAVLCALGAKNPLTRQPQLAIGMHNILMAMELAGVPRLVYLSADTVSAARRELNVLRRYILIPLLFGGTAADHEIDEAMIRQSHLDWVIVRPPVLTNGTHTGDFRAGEDLTMRAFIPAISRADVANFMLKQLTDDRFLHQMPIVMH